MPYSLHDQLKLFSPKRFEELCGQLLKAGDVFIVPVEGKGGDEGVDIFRGPLDTPKQERTDEKLLVWQVKHFPTGLGRSQKEQAIKSLERVIETQDPDIWTLCVPFEFSLDDHRWLGGLREKYSGLIIELFDAPAIMNLLLKPENKSLLNANFLLPNNQRIEREVLDLLTDFDLVSERLSEDKLPTKTESEFYNGAVADWKDIHDNLDARREIIGELWDFVIEAEKCNGALVSFAVLAGLSGEGKSTVLRRVAAELVRSGRNEVFWHKPGRNDLSAEQFDHLPKDSLVYIFVDSIMLFGPDAVSGFLERLRDFPIRPIVVSAAITSLWDGLKLNVGSYADLRKIDLGHMSPTDIEALLDKLSENECRMPTSLGKLAGLSRDQQVYQLSMRANRQLLVALIEAKGGQGFDQHVVDELRKLRSANGDVVRKACTYVSALHRFDLRMPRSLLSRLIGEHIFIEDQVLSKTHGLVELTFADDNVITRHPVVANVIFEHEAGGEFGWYERIIAEMDQSDEALAEQLVWAMTGSEKLLPNVHRWPDLELGSDLLTRACRYDIQVLLRVVKRFAWDASDISGYARFLGGRGDVDGARTVFRIGLTAAKPEVPYWEVWAFFEREQGNIGDRECPAEYTARWLLRTAIKTGRIDFQTWFKWASMEENEGNIGDTEDPAPYTAKWILRKGAEQNPQELNFPASLATIEREQGNWDEMYRLDRMAAERMAEADERSSYYCSRSREMANLGKMDYALRYGELSVREDPNDGWAHSHLAGCYHSLGRRDEAERSCLKALELLPNAKSVRAKYEEIKRAREEEERQI